MKHDELIDEKPKMTQASELAGCPFCGSRPFFGLGKKGSCQLHGEPFQAVTIYCKKHECPAKPLVSGGDIYNGGEAKARIEVAKMWNKRAAPTYGFGNDSRENYTLRGAQ